MCLFLSRRECRRLVCHSQIYPPLETLPPVLGLPLSLISMETIGLRENIFLFRVSLFSPGLLSLSLCDPLNLQSPLDCFLLPFPLTKRLSVFQSFLQRDFRGDGFETRTIRHGVRIPFSPGIEVSRRRQSLTIETNPLHLLPSNIRRFSQVDHEGKYRKKKFFRRTPCVIRQLQSCRN